MSVINCSLDLKPLQVMVQARGLEAGGEVQKYIDSEVIRLSDPYVPFDTGMLKHSAISATVIGSGVVVYNTPYASKQYYGNRGVKGLRGPRWFERMKADRREDILRGAAKIAGGEATK